MQEGGGGKSGLEMETVCVNMYSLIGLCVCACTHVGAHAHVFTHMSVYVYACILSQDYMCVCMCIHDCVCAHTYTYIHSHIWNRRLGIPSAGPSHCLTYPELACQSGLQMNSDHLLGFCLISGTTVRGKGFALAHGLRGCSPSWWGGHAL